MGVCLSWNMQWLTLGRVLGKHGAGQDQGMKVDHPRCLQSPQSLQGRPLAFGNQSRGLCPVQAGLHAHGGQLLRLSDVTTIIQHPSHHLGG